MRDEACSPSTSAPPVMPLHPKEQALLAYIRSLKFATLHRLVIQDGLPVLAEEVYRTIKF